jgi:NRAMP (natural resistance-associated macrophage protein)-like metal ion transporter
MAISPKSTQSAVKTPGRQAPVPAAGVGPRPPGPIRRFFSVLGPGLISGAADDDPSGITTYSIAGAQLGTSLLWTALLTWPLMAAIQLMCARISMETGRGLAGSLKKKFPKPLILLAAVALFAANTINIAADLAGMAEVGQMLSGLNSNYFVVIFGAVITVATIQCRYAQISGVLKWLTLILFAYVITAFIIRPNWGSVLRDTFTPSVPHGHEAWGMLVAILGTTISPYLFFWQASQEVEEKKAEIRETHARPKRPTLQTIWNRMLDVGTGTFFSNLVMFFIIVTTAFTLHKSGNTQIETSRQAAEALRPLAGSFATVLYTVGILGVGFLSIPTLTGSAAYAFAEVFHWRQGLDENMDRASKFYGVVIFATVLAIAINFAKINPVKALYWSAVINGLVAPFLLVGILIIASDAALMKQRPSSRISRVVVGITAVLMFAAGVAMFIF